MISRARCSGLPRHARESGHPGQHTPVGAVRLDSRFRGNDGNGAGIWAVCLGSQLALAVGAWIALAAPAHAATGTLDTGALTPQTYSSRTAVEVENTGASAQKGHEGMETGLQNAAGAPREAGDVASHAGRNRPTQ
jgi:hypothetical protein